MQYSVTVQMQTSYQKTPQRNGKTDLRIFYIICTKKLIDEATCKQIHPTGSNPSKLYGLPKNS